MRSLIFLILCFFTISFKAQTVDVTFRVDMQFETVSLNGVHLAGSMQGWNTVATPMNNPNGDNVWEVTLSLDTGSYYEYKFINGNAWGSDEILASWEWCQVNGNRFHTVGNTSYDLDPYVFGSCNVLVVYGCMDSTAQNYNPQATNEDSSCIYSFLGCTDSLSCNYNPQAIIDDSSCYYFEIDLGNDTILCSMSTLNLGVAGNYSYLWNTSDTTPIISINSAGNYSVQILDSLGCEFRDSINIYYLPIPYVDIGNDQSICNTGDTIVLDAGNNWTSYLWSDSSINQTLIVYSSGLYSVVVTDSLGCQGNDYVNITSDSLPTSSFTYSINGSTVNFVNISINAKTYLWDFYSDESFIDTSSGNVEFNYQNNGLFNVSLIASNSCGSDTMMASIEIISANIVEHEIEYQIYPNPCAELFYISFNKKSNNKLIITDLLGKIYFEDNLEERDNKIDVSSFPKGIYLINVLDETIKKYKLIIN